MSADRYEITVDGPCVTIKEPCGFSGEYHRSEYADNVLYGAIRQQARDIAEWDRLFTAVVSQSLPNAPQLWPFDGEQGPAMVAFAIHQLRTDLAAAVAENAALLAANRDCILHFDAIKADYDAMKLRAEQAEARLAAIAAQPTLAIWGGWIDVSESDVPPDEAELIARPAKD